MIARFAAPVPFSRFRRFWLLLLLISALGLPAAPAAGQSSPGAPNLVSDGAALRLSGASRFETSARVAAALWPEGAKTVLIATGSDYPDALAGGALAAARSAPLLLTPRDKLEDSVRQQLLAWSPEEILILGGEAAVSKSVERELRDLFGPVVRRIAGRTRYETAAAAATEAGRDGNGFVALATGLDYPDAVAAGALTAGASPVPTLLVAGDQLVVPPRSGEVALLIGGPGVLSEQVAASARARARDVGRLSGPNRFATSQAVADYALRRRLSGRTPLVIATGGNFPDALVAGAAAGRAGGPVLLIPRDGPTIDQEQWISRNRGRFTGAIVLGGPAAVSEAARTRVQALLRGAAPRQQPPPPPPPQAAPPKTSPPPSSPPRGCHPSYPTVCIPPPPPDLDCKHIPYRRFPVRPPDPHRFDADKDGIGCESDR